MYETVCLCRNGRVVNVMFNWHSGQEKSAPASRDEHDVSRLASKIEQLEQALLQLAKETRKQSIVVRQLHINHPVVENVTFRLDALDIEELSGSLNLGNNFDVQLDPKQWFKSGKDKETQKTGSDAGSSSSKPEATAARKAAKAAEGVMEGASVDDAAFRRTSTGYSYRASSASASNGSS